jgi:hypothetical protein
MPKRRIAVAPAQGGCELALPANKGPRLTFRSRRSSGIGPSLRRCGNRLSAQEATALSPMALFPLRISCNTSRLFCAYAVLSTRLSSTEHDASVATRAFPVASRSILA